MLPLPEGEYLFSVLGGTLSGFSFNGAKHMKLNTYEGEGRGEGEEIVRIWERRGFCNRFSSFGFLADFITRISDLLSPAIEW